jgi:hypothetical protein
VVPTMPHRPRCAWASSADTSENSSPRRAPGRRTTKPAQGAENGASSPASRHSGAKNTASAVYSPRRRRKARNAARLRRAFRAASRANRRIAAWRSAGVRGLHHARRNACLTCFPRIAAVNPPGTPATGQAFCCPGPRAHPAMHSATPLAADGRSPTWTRSARPSAASRGIFALTRRISVL